MNQDLSSLSNQFVRMFLHLDGSPMAQRPEVTSACVAVLFDRMLNPPESEPDIPPTEQDVDRTVQALVSLIEEEADRVRSLIREDQ